MIDDDLAPEEENAPAGRRWLQIIGVALIAVALLLALYGTVAYVAWQRGESIRVEDERRSLEEELDKQMSLARENVESGNFELASERLEWVLAQRPDHPGALELRETVLAEQNPERTPMPAAAPTFAAATATPLIIGPDPEVHFADLEELVANEEWESAVLAITTFQKQFPNYNRRDTDTMLYDASINYGLSLVKGDQVELGLFYFSQAEKLGDLPTEVEDYRTWSELYLLGIGYYGVDWGTMVSYFRGLCAAAPFFQDSCVKLREALLAHANQYAGSQDWCPAEELYLEALRLRRDQSVAEQLDEAGQRCLQATPTPTISITATITTE